MKINWLNCVVLLPVAGLMGTGISVIVPNGYGLLLGGLAGYLLGFFAAHRGVYLIEFK